MQTIRTWLSRLRYRCSNSLVKRYVRWRHGKTFEHVSFYWPHLRMECREENRFLRYGRRTRIPIHDFRGLRTDQCEDLYILGCGPSVKDLDWVRLRGKPIIFLNGAIQAAARHDLTPFATVILDHTFVMRRPDLLRLTPPSTPLVLSLSAAKAVSRFAPEMLRVCGIHIGMDPRTPYLEAGVPMQDLKGRAEFIVSVETDSGFSLDPDAGLFDGGTVMSWAIQLAWHIGFRNVWLLGLDIGNAAEPRFYETDVNRLKSGLMRDYENKILPFMTLAGKVFAKAGRGLYNCSPISILPPSVIPRRAFEESSDDLSGR